MFHIMSSPLYSIGDRIPNTDVIVRGVMTPSTDDHRYFVQIVGNDNSMVISQSKLNRSRLKFPRLVREPEQ